MKIQALLFVVLLVAGFWSCKKDEAPKNSDCDTSSFNDYVTYRYYNDGTPQISAEPIDMNGNVQVSEAFAAEVGNSVEITISGIRVRSENQNFEVQDFIINEKSITETCFVKQDEFSAGASSFKTKIASVLVLDMSSSLTSIIDNLKSYAKEYARTVVNSSSNSQVAVVFFSGRNAIESTDFYNASDIAVLESIIDNFSNYQDRTALYQATSDGLSLLENLSFDGEKSLVVFTDGGDNDSNNPSTLVQEIQSSTINRFAIGLKGNDFRESNLTSITSTNSNMVVADNDASLENVFRVVGRGVISVYELTYVRSNQLLSPDEAIDIRISVESAIIE